MVKTLVEVSGLKVQRSESFWLSVPELKLAAGKIICITGPNGSGKTTFIEALIGLIKQKDGFIKLNGQAVNNDLRSTKALIGFVPDDEEWFIKGLSAKEYFKLIANVYRSAGVKTDMQSRVSQLAEALSFTAMDRLLEELSHGNKKKVQIIAGLMHGPKVIILDELRNGLDPLAIIEAERLINAEAKNGACVIATTHDLWWAERIADDIMLLVNGSPAVYESKKALVKKHGNLETLFKKTVGVK